MSATPTIPWEQYQKLPPIARSRPLTDEEYSQLSPEQMQSAGLAEPSESAPADFGGRVLPNPTHIRPQLDTDPTTPITRLPQGIAFHHENFSGAPQMDISNPAAADIQPAMGREVGAQMSTQPVSPKIALPAGATLESAPEQNDTAMKLPPGATLDTPGGEKTKTAATSGQPSVMQVLTQPTEKTDKEYLGYTGLPGVVGATVHGLNRVAQGTEDAAKGAWDMLKPPSGTGETVSALLGGPAGVMAYRGAKPMISAAAEVPKIPAAVKDINASPDPVSHYANAAEDTAAQGAGQALTAIATEGAGRAIPRIAPPVIRLAARGAETALNQKLLPVRELANLGTPADEAAALQVKVPGRDFGLKSPRIAAPELDATGENKPFAGGLDEPKPRVARILDATGENRPFAGGMDEPRAALPRIAKPPGSAGSIAESVLGSGDPILDRLRANAARIEQEGHGNAFREESETTPRTTNLNEDLTPALEASLRKVNAAKARIAAPTPAPDAYPVKIVYDEHGIPTAETDGRHRVIQAIERGDERIPVTVDRGHGPVETTVDPKVLARQMGVTKESLAATDAQQPYRRGNLQPRAPVRASQ
jgi:hypothetical protein